MTDLLSLSLTTSQQLLAQLLYAMNVAVPSSVGHVDQGARLPAELMPCALTAGPLANEHLILGIGAVLEAVWAIQAHVLPVVAAVVDPQLCSRAELLGGAHRDVRVCHVERACFTSIRRLTVRLLHDGACRAANLAMRRIGNELCVGLLASAEHAIDLRGRYGWITKQHARRSCQPAGKEWRQAHGSVNGIAKTLELYFGQNPTLVVEQQSTRLNSAAVVGQINRGERRQNGGRRQMRSLISL